MMTRAEIDLEKRAAFFKALGHPSRLLILNLIQAKPRHGEELAAILRLNPATVSHHLTILAEAGLLSSHKDQYYQTWSPVPGVLKKSLAEMVALPQPDLSGSVAEDAFREKVLQTFFQRGRLVSIPAQLKKQQIVLEKLAAEFEPEREYTEKEVNLILLDFHDDVAFLRRSLVDSGLMVRDHGIYQRKAGGDAPA